MHLRQSLLVLAAVLAVVACADVTAPRRLQPRGVTRDFIPPADETIYLVVSGSGFGVTATVPNYPALTLVHVSITGSVTATIPENIELPTDLPAGGTVWNTYSCAGGAGFYTTYGGVTSAYCGAAPDGYTLIAGGPNSASTGGYPCCANSFSGSYAVTITRVPATPTLTSNKSAVTSGESVTFTAAISPDSMGGIRVPRSMTWSWQPDSVGASGGTLSCQWYDYTCPFTPPTSGTMWWGGTVNGKSDSIGKHVDVVPCLRTDSTSMLTAVLNSHSVRRVLDSIWTASNPSASDPADRKEQGAAIYYDSLTGQVFAEADIRSTNTPCHSVISRYASNTYQHVLVGTVHTHPYHIDESIPDSTVTNGCPNGNFMYGTKQT